MPRTAPKRRAAASTKTALSTTPAVTAKSVPASDFAIGDRVEHPKFGNGIVQAIDGDKLTIQFTGNVTKQIVDDYVKRR